MSPLRHNLSDKLTGLIHITRAQTHLQSPVAVVEQLHRAEYLKKKKKKINPSELRIHLSRNLQVRQAVSYISHSSIKPETLT